MELDKAVAADVVEPDVRIQDDVDDAAKLVGPSKSALPSSAFESFDFGVLDDAAYWDDLFASPPPKGVVGGVLPNPYNSEPDPPPEWPADIEWWARRMWNGFLPLRRPFKRKLNVEILCAGTAAEIMGGRIMDIPLSVNGLADSKKISQKWLKRHWTKSAAHMYCDNSSMERARGGFCFLHGQHCAGPTKRPDVMSGGFPCQPFSQWRQKNGKSNKTGGAANHPLVSVVMTGLLEYVRGRRPHCIWVEEVEGFMRRHPSLDHQSPCQVVVAALQDEGYTVIVLKMNHNLFITVSRPRIFLVAIDDECGGQAGCDFVEQTVSQLLQARSLEPPTCIWDLVDPKDPVDIARRKSSKAMLVCCYSFITS